MKQLCVPTMHFYKLVQFHIWIHFQSTLSIRISNSGQTVKCTRKYSMDKPYHKLHHYIPPHSTRHHTLLHTPMILHTKTLFAPEFHQCKKLFSKEKLPHSSLLQTRTFHTSYYTSTYNLKIDSIESDNIPLVWIKINPIQSHIRVG